MQITFITGGARSGKSNFSENLAKDIGKKIIYIATALPIDKDMKDRIKKHIKRRPVDWITIEQYKNFNDLSLNKDFVNCDTIILDCITILISNLLFDSEVDFSNCSNKVIEEIEKSIFEEIKELIKVVKENNKNLILVSNEVGMGLVPHYRLGNIFRDISGRVNQYLSNISDNVFILFSGIPLKLK